MRAELGHELGFGSSLLAKAGVASMTQHVLRNPGRAR
jgi:hypothetical protein